MGSPLQSFHSNTVLFKKGGGGAIEVEGVESTLRRLYPADLFNSALSIIGNVIVTGGGKVYTPPETLSNKGKTGMRIIVINVSEVQQPLWLWRFMVMQRYIVSSGHMRAGAGQKREREFVEYKSWRHWVQIMAANTEITLQSLHMKQCGRRESKRSPCSVFHHRCDTNYTKMLTTRRFSEYQGSSAMYLTDL